MTGLTINWATKVISVAKDYLTPTANPTIFNLDTNQFRLDLKSLEASEEGMSYVDTHQHNTEVPLGGIIYARVIEIINGYTITFENGFYSVNLFGSNNNIGDVVNLNFVSVRTNNSAGLIVDPGIQESLDYGEHIVYDAVNGVSGVAHPVGTYASPVNNIPDLQTLLNTYGRAEVLCLSDIELTQSFSGTSFVSKTGQDHFHPNGFKANECSFIRLAMDGDFNHSQIYATDCVIESEGVQNIGGVIHSTICFGPIKLTPDYQLVLNKCSSTIPGTDAIEVDMVVGIETIFATRGHSGPLNLFNCDTTGSTATIIFEAGNMIIDNSCTDGLIVLGGIATLDDNSTTGCTVDITGVIDPDTSNTIAYNEKINIQSGSTNTGTEFPVGTLGVPVNNIVDALVIASERGIGRLHFHGDYTFKNGDFINDFTIVGDGLQKSHFLFETGAVMLDCIFEDAKISGDITGMIGFSNCHLYNIGSTNLTPSSQDIVLNNCLMDGYAHLTPSYSGTVKMIDCKSGVAGMGTPKFNFSGASSNILIRNYAGGMELQNCDKDVAASIDMLSGRIVLNDDITNGNFTIRGVGSFEDRTSDPKVVLNTNGLVDGRDIRNAKIAAETLRPHHTGYGNTYYWDPFEGDDTSDGKSLETATKTFAHAHDLVVNGHHDVIICVAGETGTTITTENIIISKNYTFVRGPGLDFRIIPELTDGTPSVYITGHGVELSGIFVGTSTTGVTNSIHSHNCDFTLIDKVWLKGSTGHGIYFTGNGLYHRIDRTFMDETVGDGIRFDGNIRHIVVENTEIANAEGNGITIMGGDGAGKFARNNVIGQNTLIHGTHNYGVHFSGGTNKNTVSFNADLYLNALGNVLDEGIDNTDKSFINDANIQQFLTYDTTLFYDENNGFSGQTFPIGTSFKPVNNLVDALVIANRYNIDEFQLSSDMFVTSDITNLKIIGNDVTQVTSSGNTVNGCSFDGLQLAGDFNNSFIVAERVSFANVDNIWGSIDNCYLNGEIKLSLFGDTTISHSTSSVPGISNPTIDMNSGGTATLSVRAYSGGLTIKNANTSGDTATVEFIGGKMHIDPSCTDGLLDIRGVAWLGDNSQGTTVLSNALLDPSNIATSGATGSGATASEVAIAVWNELTATHNISGSFGKLLTDLVVKADLAQHTLNVNTDLLNNKPNNP